MEQVSSNIKYVILLFSDIIFYASILRFDVGGSKVIKFLNGNNFYLFMLDEKIDNDTS